MRPQAVTIDRGKHLKLIVYGDGENPAVGDGGRAVYWTRNRLAPNHLAGGGIEREHLGITGGDVEPAVGIGDAAAEIPVIRILGLDIEAPDAIAAFGIVGGDRGLTVLGKDA